MRALVDTHVFLWTASQVPRLSARARRFIGDGENELYLSVASAWEIAIKFAKGHLELPESPIDYVPTRMTKHGFDALPVSLAHALRVSGLPHHHRDPFDRLLVAQALVEGLPIVTGDENFARYGVEVVW